MLQFISSSVCDAEAAKIERFRARHRRLLRNQLQPSTSANVEDLDVDDGRKRKVSAKWRQKQQMQLHNHQSDSQWAVSADGEMFGSFNAFDFSTSPEAFETEHRTAMCNADTSQQRMAQVAKQVSSMGFHCPSMWERTCQVFDSPEKPLDNFLHSGTMIRRTVSGDLLCNARRRISDKCCCTNPNTT